MTQPPRQGQFVPDPTAAPPADGTGYGLNRFERNTKPHEPAEGPFSYETVSPTRAATGPPPAGPRPAAGSPAAGAPAASGPAASGPGYPPAGLRPPLDPSAAAPPVGPVRWAGPPPVSTPRPPAPNRPAARNPRRARLQVRHINPWTVFKFACVLSVALFFIWLLTVAALYGILDAAGAIGKINNAVTTVNGPGSTPPVRASIVLVGAIVIGAVNIVLFIALSTIGAVVYNLCADLIGGIELTLSERET